MLFVMAFRLEERSQYLVLSYFTSKLDSDWSIQITFTFPFYGHDMTKITIATGGFLYMSDFLHQWLTATQYIAPLMANFDTRIGEKSLIHYADNGTALIVLWENVHLKDDEKAGPFTFEVILHKDGTIIFSYYEIPIKLSNISNAAHPVKVGLSDAYYIDRETSNGRVKQRTIYEYHRVRINTTRIASHTAFIITPLTTCNMFKACAECLLETATTSFNCMWCPATRRCSNGLDRKRQEWLENKCYVVDITVDQCRLSGQSSSFNAGILFAILMLLCVVGVLVGWVIYAYRNPNTRSGQWLIEHRPSRLKDQLAKVKFWKRSDDSVGERIWKKNVLIRRQPTSNPISSERRQHPVRITSVWCASPAFSSHHQCLMCIASIWCALPTSGAI
ncbi:Plexin domain-containing protein 2 [Lamellibrachia satsuma]|nr:Plexin domain-containing protein 2 [Lamellibrachia satsuma]